MLLKRLKNLNLMKYKKMKERLSIGQKNWENLPQKEKAERKRPGSVKWR